MQLNLLDTCRTPTKTNIIRNCIMINANLLDDYVNSAECGGDVAPLLRSRIDYLAQGGYRVLHDLVVILRPLMDMTIEEGEYYATSSVVIPRLLAAKRKIDSILASAKSGNNSNGRIIDPRMVLS